MPKMISLALLLVFAATAPASPATVEAPEHLLLAQAEQVQEDPAAPTDSESEPDTETEAAPAQETAPPEPPAPAQEAAPSGEPAPAEEAAPSEEPAPAQEAAPSEEAETAPDAQADQPATPPATEAPPEAAEPAPEPPAAAPAPAEQEQVSGAASEEEAGILRSESALPEPVRETWRALLAAARSGQIENLQPIIENQPEPPMVAFDEIGEPIAHLRSLSGDAEGREILAILLEVLEAGFLHVDEGTPQEMYLWPYFARHPIDELTPPQMVELFTLLTAGDYQDMLSYGAYIFFRVGIAPDGRWLFFVAGD